MEVIFMNGEIAQVCNIVLASRSALKKRNNVKYRPAYYEKETEFIFLDNQKYTAKNVEEWFEYCINRGLQNIKFLIPTSVKDRNFLGFINTSQASLVCFFENNLVTYFIPKWEYFDNKWCITYTEHKWENPPKKKPKFFDNTEDFKNILRKIATFADKIDFQNFANIFTKAFNILNGDNIENIGNVFYTQYFFELPETNKKLFYASDISDVFGAMGSWNDSPPYYAAEKGLENEYNNLSSELLTQIRLALLYSVNEW